MRGESSELSRYLVTGGAGFIGSHLVETLAEQGEEIRVADDLSTGRRKNLAHLEGRYAFLQGDLADLAFARAAVEGVDYVLHQAALPSVPRSVQDPISSNRANVDATLNLLVCARDAGVRRFVFASSSSVYGDDPELPKREDSMGRPLSPYALTKLTGEYYCGMFHGLYGLPTVALRYFNVFGPRQDPQSTYAAVVPRFIAAALVGDGRPTIYGDGEQTRDFTFVENVVHANLAACVSGQESLGKAFNIACADRTSILGLAETVCGICGVSCRPVLEPPRAGDVRHSLADISLARSLLGYAPKVDLREGLQRTIEAMRRSGPDAW